MDFKMTAYNGTAVHIKRSATVPGNIIISLDGEVFALKVAEAKRVAEELLRMVEGK